MAAQIQAGFSEKVISPDKGVSLCGYFNNRYNVGIRDDLYAKAIAVSDGQTTFALVVADNTLVFSDVVSSIRGQVAQQTGIPEHHVLVQATHTHTAPVLKPGFWVDFSPAYLEYFIEQAVAAVLQAHAEMEPVTFDIAEGEESRVAFCRRFIMRDGTAATNPPRNSPDIVRPESEIDHSFAVVAVKNLSGDILGVLVHCANHVDTIGGDLVSADWPGVLCRMVTEGLPSRPQTMLLNGMAGNVNHFNINDPEQSDFSESEAEKVGTAYGETGLSLLQTAAHPLAVSSIGAGHVIVDLPRLQLTQEQVAEAEAIVARIPIPRELTFLHSADVTRNNDIVRALFAGKQLEFARENRCSEHVEVSGVRIGDLLIVGLPFEAFSEIGMEMKRRSPFEHTFALELLNGSHGYLAPREAAERPGGMETFPGVDCLRSFVPEAADMLTDAAEGLAQSLADRDASPMN